MNHREHRTLVVAVAVAVVVVVNDKKCPPFGGPSGRTAHPTSPRPLRGRPSGTDSLPHQPPHASHAPVAATPFGGFGTDSLPHQPPHASHAPVAATTTYTTTYTTTGYQAGGTT